jgi:hypothetical protein
LTESDRSRAENETGVLESRNVLLSLRILGIVRELVALLIDIDDLVFGKCTAITV